MFKKIFVSVMDIPIDDFVRREDIFYKKFTEVPFAGTVAGKAQGQSETGSDMVLVFITTTMDG